MLRGENGERVVEIGGRDRMAGKVGGMEGEKEEVEDGRECWRGGRKEEITGEKGQREWRGREGR